MLLLGTGEGDAVALLWLAPLPSAHVRVAIASFTYNLREGSVLFHSGSRRGYAKENTGAIAYLSNNLREGSICSCSLTYIVCEGGSCLRLQLFFHIQRM